MLDVFHQSYLYAWTMKVDMLLYDWTTTGGQVREPEKKYFNNFIPDIHSDLSSKTNLLDNSVSPWDPIVCERSHVPVCLQVGTTYPLFIYCKLFII
jgi:hypothetical protein